MQKALHKHRESQNFWLLSRKWNNHWNYYNKFKNLILNKKGWIDIYRYGRVVDQYLEVNEHISVLMRKSVTNN